MDSVGEDRERLEAACLLMRRDHERMRDLWHEMTRTLEAGGDEALFRDCAAALLSYARAHFRNEEWVMRLTGFPDYADHKADHDQLISDAEDMLHNMDVAFAPPDWPAVATFFRHWMRKHGDTADARLEAHLRALASRTEGTLNVS